MLIGFGFWGSAPVGFDLQTLLVGDVQICRRGADDRAAIARYCLERLDATA